MAKRSKPADTATTTNDTTKPKPKPTPVVRLIGGLQDLAITARGAASLLSTIDRARHDAAQQQAAHANQRAALGIIEQPAEPRHAESVELRTAAGERLDALVVACDNAARLIDAGGLDPLDAVASGGRGLHRLAAAERLAEASTLTRTTAAMLSFAIARFGDAARELDELARWATATRHQLAAATRAGKGDDDSGVWWAGAKIMKETKSVLDVHRLRAAADRGNIISKQPTKRGRHWYRLDSVVAYWPETRQYLSQHLDAGK